MTTSTTAPNIKLAEVDAIVAGIGREAHHAIVILQAIQEKYNYLPREALCRVCEITGLSTFYGQFRHRLAGKHIIKLCSGMACQTEAHHYVLGQPQVLSYILEPKECKNILPRLLRFRCVF